MHEGQAKFYEYMIDKMEEERKEEGIMLLKESFERQEQGTFTTEYLDDISVKLLALIKPGFKEEVKNIFEQFGKMHISK